MLAESLWEAVDSADSWLCSGTSTPLPSLTPQKRRAKEAFSKVSLVRNRLQQIQLTFNPSCPASKSWGNGLPSRTAQRWTFAQGEVGGSPPLRSDLEQNKTT